MGSGYIVQRRSGKDYSLFHALVNDSITEVTAEMLDGCGTIGDYAFYNCDNLTSVDIPGSITSIGGYAFSQCDVLRSIYIPSSVTAMGSSAFYGCTVLESANIQSGLTSLAHDIFELCRALTNITIPSSVTSIGNASFRTTGLRNVIIPNSVSSIGISAFSGCTALTSVTVEATTPPTLGTGVFSSTSSNLVIYVPTGSVDAYKTATNWSTYASRIQAIP